MNKNPTTNDIREAVAIGFAKQEGIESLDHGRRWFNKWYKGQGQTRYMLLTKELKAAHLRNKRLRKKAREAEKKLAAVANYFSLDGEDIFKAVKAEGNYNALDVKVAGWVNDPKNAFLMHAVYPGPEEIYTIDGYTQEEV